jgi:hypothetical protein
MNIEQKQADAYLKELMQAFEKDSSQIEPVSRRVIIKFREAQKTIERLVQDFEQIKNQIKQAETRARTIELQVADMQGKASGHIELLLSMKFEPDDSAVIEQDPKVRSIQALDNKIETSLKKLPVKGDNQTVTSDNP